MSVRVWFEDDIRNALKAVALSGELAESGEFRRGFCAAVVIMGTAFGIAPVVEIENGKVADRGARVKRIYDFGNAD